MRKILLLGFILCLFGLQNVYGQEEKADYQSPHAMVAKVLFNDYALPNGFDGDTLKMSNGLEFGYIRNINKYLNIAFPLKVGLANVSGFRNKRTIFSADALLQVQYYKDEAKVVPYLFGGGGVVTENFEMTNVQFPMGVGVNLRIGENSYFNLQGEYRKSQAADRDNLQYGAGFWFRLGQRKYEEQLGLDTDGDTVPDIQDECPTEAGLPGLLGCPDTDGDGIADKIDECPDELGVAATLGCPDLDGDGVKDANDLCPSQPGTLENNGCPETNSDRDHDGINDELDMCPDEAGLARTKGCPDSDQDGVMDSEDDCPNTPGPISKKGCPSRDSDGDGILDEQDACPDVAGPLVLEGCPDTDGDGVLDKNDDCPDVPGAASTRGCPNIDSDGDGVVDSKDACPYQAGSPKTGGCPDTDGDGVLDSADQCPYQAGPAERGGCPFIDADGDGVEDKDDECPAQAGSKATSGCPDSDQDGVADKFDACPNTPGPYRGCPDTDGDGVDDSQDSCPNTAGSVSNYGCPEIKPEEKEVIVAAAQAVVFEVGKATLKAESYAVLDQVADILLKYPDYKVMISGHTDNTGKSESNKALSQERANSCYEYLVSKGISRHRMQFKGMGEEKPIASNATEEGRELNRRVEFDLYVR
ncbi:MAG: thrombospondin type 3 repeat-containing protein [Saprospiraceae bacterium]|nr:thrombospondin type 3 repeat-containing protein [Saprospiraceae bacterium]